MIPGAGTIPFRIEGEVLQSLIYRIRFLESRAELRLSQNLGVCPVPEHRERFQYCILCIPGRVRAERLIFNMEIAFPSTFRVLQGAAGLMGRLFCA